MRRARLALLTLALVAALSVVSPAGALANGCNSSAGDSQYFDPLQSCTPQPPPTSGQTHSAGAGTPVTSTTATTASTTTPTTDPQSSKSLPFTGLNLGPAIAIGVVLLCGGVLLRRLATRGNPG